MDELSRLRGGSARRGSGHPSVLWATILALVIIIVIVVVLV